MGNVSVDMNQFKEPILIILAIIAGSLTGSFTSLSVTLVDQSIIALLFFLFYNISFDKYQDGAKNKKY